MPGTLCQYIFVNVYLQYLKDIGYEVVLLKDRGDDYVDAIGKEIADFEARKEELSKVCLIN